MTGSAITQIERDRRAAYAARIESEMGIGEPMIKRLIHRFYRRIREDALLGPVCGANHRLEPASRVHVCILVFGGFDERALPRPSDAGASAIAD